MEQEAIAEAGIIGGEKNDTPEAMVRSKERWEEVRRLHGEERLKVSQIARRLDVDRKTVRKALRAEWKRYERPMKIDTLLAEHTAFLRERAAQVNYSAKILHQELVRDGFGGGYDTVKRFVAPLRAAATVDRVCMTRFETQPGEQSQIDWGQARAHLRRHVPPRAHREVLPAPGRRAPGRGLAAREHVEEPARGHSLRWRMTAPGICILTSTSSFATRMAVSPSIGLHQGIDRSVYSGH